MPAQQHLDAHIQAAARKLLTGLPSIEELRALRLHHRVAWPLGMIVDAAALEQYNQVLVCLLQVSARLTLSRSQPCFHPLRSWRVLIYLPSTTRTTLKAWACTNIAMMPNSEVFLTN